MPNISKVTLNGETLMDVTNDTVNSNNLLAGESATMNNGVRTTGSLSLDGYALKTMLAPVETTTTASAAYTAGDFLIYNDALYMATKNIAIGDTFSSSNTEEVKTADELDGLYQSVANSIGAYYEPTTIASRDYSDGNIVLVRGYGLYFAIDLGVGDDITNHPDTAPTDLSSLIQKSLATKANIASPTFTGTPKAPTAASGKSNTQIATTEFVANSISSKANLASPTFTGTPKAPTATSGTSNTQIATTEFVANSISSKANLASPTFTGTPKAPTAASGTNTTQIATTAFVQDAVESRLVVNPNLIRNWYFIGGGSQQGNGQLPINRSGLTIFPSSSSKDGAIIDGYYFNANQKSNGATILESDGLVIEQNAEYGYGGSSYYIGQDIFSTEVLHSAQVTISILVTEFQKTDADGQTGSIKFMIGQRTNNTTTFTGSTYITNTGLFSTTTRLYSKTFDTLCPQIYLNNTGSGTRIKIAAWKLEIGSAQTLAHLDNGNWVLNELPDYNEQLLKCESSPNTTKTNQLQYSVRGFGQAITNNMISNPNLLRNAVFATNGTKLPINSRGQANYQGGGMTIDGWYLRNSSGGDGSGQPSITISQSGLDLQCNGKTHRNLQGFHQNVNDFQSLAGKTVTLSILIISNTSTGTKCEFGVWNSTSVGTNNTTVDSSISNIIESTGLVTKTFAMPASFTNNNLNVGIFPSTNSDIQMRIAAIKMELGDTQTLAHMVNGKWVLNEYPDYSEEVAKCLTSTANTSDVYSGFVQAFGKLTAAGNPCMRFYTGDGKAFQLSYGGSPLKLNIERYDGSTWTTLASFTPDA